MEGSGVIDVEKLYAYKASFGFFARQFMYPEKLDFHPDLLDDSFTEQHPAREDVLAYWSCIQKLSMDEIQEMYTETFDFQKDCALYMTYFKFEDAKERGQMLLRLKVLYEMFGLLMPAGELPDYLPLICEFLYAAEWLGEPNAAENFRLLFAVLEDGTYHLFAALEKLDSPYCHLVKGLRRMLKACIEQEIVSL